MWKDLSIMTVGTVTLWLPMWEPPSQGLLVTMIDSGNFHLCRGKWPAHILLQKNCCNYEASTFCFLFLQNCYDLRIVQQQYNSLLNCTLLSLHVILSSWNFSVKYINVFTLEKGEAIGMLFCFQYEGFPQTWILGLLKHCKTVWRGCSIFGTWCLPGNCKPLCTGLEGHIYF